MKRHKFDDISEMLDIFENVTVIYKDGIQEQFDAVRITDKGVIIGRIFDGKFVVCGFIPKYSIKEIKNKGKRKN